MDFRKQTINRRLLCLTSLQLLEAIITLVLGFVAWFYIPDFPDQNKFLTPEQTAFVLKRIDEDRGDAMPDLVTKEKVKRYLQDWTIWAHGKYLKTLSWTVAVISFRDSISVHFLALVYVCYILVCPHFIIFCRFHILFPSNYSQRYGMEWDPGLASGRSQIPRLPSACLKIYFDQSAPPYGPPVHFLSMHLVIGWSKLQIFTTFLIAYLADKYKHRSGFLLGASLVCIAGTALLAFAKDNGVRYFG